MRERDVVATIAYGDERERVAYDAVVVAIGFDGRWCEALLGEEASGRYRDALRGGELERVIDADLSVAGLAPPRGDSVHRTIVLPGDLAERLAAEAALRGISLSDLLAEYAGQGLRQAR